MAPMARDGAHGRDDVASHFSVQLDCGMDARTLARSATRNSRFNNCVLSALSTNHDAVHVPMIDVVKTLLSPICITFTSHQQ